MIEIIIAIILGLCIAGAPCFANSTAEVPVTENGIPLYDLKKDKK